MSVNVNKENFSNENQSNEKKDNIVYFPFKNNESINNTVKEENIFSKLKKFYSIKDNDIKLNTQENSININSNNKLPPKPIAITILGIILITIVIWALTHKNAQEVYVGDKLVGIIKPNSEEIKSSEQLKELALSSLSEKTGANVEVNEDVTFKPVRASKNEIMTISEVTNKVAENFTFKVEASVITISGDDIAIVKNKEDANKILEQVKSKYVNKDVKQLSEPTFLEEVKIENKYVSEKEIEKEDTVISKFTTPQPKDAQHEIVEGDTLFEIALNNNMSLKELLKINPNLTETTPLKIGSKVNIITYNPILSVVTYEEAIYNQTIPKPIETVKNNKEYKTYKKVLSNGKDGNKQVTAKITKINGIEEKRDVISEKVLLEPIAEKIEVGTLSTPPKKSTGNFIYPVRGRFTSGYGSRWGSTHKGIDLACSYGTSIKASDGGKVIFSGWYGGYGNMVKIDHGNGYQTIYAHNSKNAVSVGQKVAQGEIIGYVGSTGNSTGNHVHFEIIQNGISKNPLNFLK